MSAIETIKEGPAGGPGGDVFTDDYPAIPGIRLAKINIWHGPEGDGLINAIQVIWNDGTHDINGAIHGKYGGTDDRGTLTQIVLEPGEYVTEIFGRCSQFVDSMTIRLNNETLDRLGGMGGRIDYSFQVPEEDWEIIGFHGRAAEFIDSIGIIGRKRADDTSPN
jgi:hypothetical protein